MPNWVSNKVKPNKRFKEIEEFVRGDVLMDNNEYRTMDFDKIIPMPKSLHITSGGDQDCAILYALYNMPFAKRLEIEEKLHNTTTSFYGNYLDKVKRFERPLKDIQERAKKFIPKATVYDDVDYEGLGIKTFEDLGNAYINNIINYGCDTWYDWAIKYWGTKWNSCHDYIEDDTFYFDTAWSCPIEVLRVLSKKFNNVEFEIEYADEDFGSNCGRLILLNGEEIEYCDMDGDREFAMKMHGYTDEDIEEYYKEQEEYEKECEEEEEEESEDNE